MRLVPRSIPGQLLVVWILAMLVAHGIAVFTMSWWRVDHSAIHPMSARTIETRVASAYRLAVAAGEPYSVLDSISLPDSSYRIAAGPLTAWSMNGKEAVIADVVRKMLDLPDAVPVQARIRQIEPAPGVADTRNWLEKTLGRPLALELHIDVGLPDGRVLSSDHWPSLIPAHWNRVLTFSLLVSMIPTTLIAVLFGLRIIRPLKILTQAANRVSRGEPVELPPVKEPDGVREITQAFNDMQESLMRLVRGRTLMVASIGHDLRTPLTSLRIRAELVEDAKLREAMIHTLDEMGVMVEGILKFAKDDASQEPTLDIPFNGFLQEVVDDQRMRGGEVEFQSQLSDAFLYRCRPVHLKRALNNLIDNAASYGAVALAARQDNARQVLVIEVLDNGPGIEADQLERVLEPFVRLDASRSNATGGSGLGLTIAQACVRAHGGAIVLKNRSEGGLRAVIELPL